MSQSYELTDRQIRNRLPRYRAIILPAFSLSLFLSAFLLFSIQPYFSKLVLPKFGGSPAVWSVAIVFFQGALLLGYTYAHALTKWTNTGLTIVIHGIVAVIAFLFLPITISSIMGDPPAEGQALWLFGLFAISVGIPFFAVSANAPLLQAWFARTGHPHAADPYFLYGSSNIGSFSSLILYIIAIEPSFTLPQQGQLWMYGFVLLSIMIIFCGFLCLNPKGSPQTITQENGEALSKEVIRPKSILGWIILAALPSGLLVSVTAHISVDVASAPFLWVIPLALFLLTFVVAFRQKPLVSADTLSRYLPFVIAATITSAFMTALMPIWATLILHLSAFFYITLYCHLLLFGRRPAATNLTAFYLWMSFGGFLGGCFTSLLAPAIFDWVLEYPLLLLAVLILKFKNQTIDQQELKKAAISGLVISLIYVGLVLSSLLPHLQTHSINFGVAVIAFSIAFFAQFKSTSFAVIFATLGMSAVLLAEQYQTDVFVGRSFFGIVKVHQSSEGPFRLMAHGTTIHGAMSTDPKEQSQTPTPLTYYHSSGGLAASLDAIQERNGGQIEEGAIIGLGTGSMSCHTKPGEKWTIFEIDDLVVKMAKDPSKFRFLSECTPDVDIILGDARLTLADHPDHSLDYLLVDAFSSDSIPVHLMTQEALRLYFSKVKSDGIVTMHISNRHMDLTEAISATAKAEGLVIRHSQITPPEELAENPYINASSVVILTRKEANFGKILDDERWTTPDPGRTRPWTDDYSNVLGAIFKKMDIKLPSLW